MAAYGIQGRTTISIKTYPRFRFRKAKVKGRSPYESISGFERSISANRWVRKTRVIDRENDKYFELVIDEASGSILHRCEEPLTEHYGHGSAKNQRI